MDKISVWPKSLTLCDKLLFEMCAKQQASISATSAQPRKRRNQKICYVIEEHAENVLTMQFEIGNDLISLLHESQACNPHDHLSVTKLN